MKFELLNWEDSFTQSHRLFEKIFLDNYVPDLIIAVARGGWIPARLIADFFRTKKTANIKVDAYELIGEIDVEAKITQDIATNVEGKNVLVVDDIADSGKSLKVVLDSLQEKKVAELKTATIHYKERSMIKPDYYVSITDAWVIYPWEYFETIQEFIETWKADELTHVEIKNKLIDIGFPVSIIDSYFSHYRND